MNIFKFILLIFVVALLTPLATSLIDALCWFYSGATCTGLAYDVVRLGVLFIASFSSLTLMMWLIG